jgi:NAD(P)-dependent dehydrogenase (short-subunit alcohol dehydrogenase family)
VAGATRGAGRGIATALGQAGATVYCSGRSTREKRSEYDHLEPDVVGALVERIDEEQGRFDVLVKVQDPGLAPDATGYR